MKSYFFRLSKTKKWLLAGGFFIVVLAAYFLFFRGNGNGYDLATVVRQNLTEEVSITGNVKAAESVSLSFERAGRVSAVYAEAGARVAAGQIIAALNATDEILALQQTEANLAAEEAALAELTRGSRSEDIVIARTKVANAEKSLADARQSLRDYLSDAYTKSNNAIGVYIDQFFNNPKTVNAQLNIIVTDNQLKTSLDTGRQLLEGNFIAWQNLLTNLNDNDLLASVNQAENYLTVLRDFLEKMASAVNALSPTSSLTLATVTTYRSDVSTARTAINTAITNLIAAKQSARDAESSLALQQAQLALTLAGTTPEALAAEEAKVAVAAAAVAIKKHAVNQSYLYAPFAGVVAKQDAKVGQVVGTLYTIGTLNSEGALIIEANVPEADISRIAVGGKAGVDLDAFPGKKFEAKVVKIAPGEIVIEGVPTYKVTFNFQTPIDFAKSGMTANISAIVVEKIGVLAVPTRAIDFRTDGAFVKVLANGQIIDRKIIIGARSSDGLMEILDGLTESEQILLNWR
ncbi:MAG: RND family efflux transporter MFP subunit [Parcubacteria group bacterium GW2011_GWB1_44_7]|nr:MAG: RND family efflux transporter MFP subunit [Parcubacteria group bacterium GW2011_GWB1_44_7]